MENLILVQKEELQTLIIDSVNTCLKYYKLPTSTPQPDSYITRQEAADILHITLPTLLTYTLDGKVKGYRIGRRVLYKKNEVEQAITAIAINKRGGAR
ncbi:MAG TPA: helix-turn-helix domain-containing protein [Hanamia sp.]|nr:helix-turn-helix domain-containing protein [Hanamia sp.]